MLSRCVLTFKHLIHLLCNIDICTVFQIETSKSSFLPSCKVQVIISTMFLLTGVGGNKNNLTRQDAIPLNQHVE